MFGSWGLTIYVIRNICLHVATVINDRDNPTDIIMDKVFAHVQMTLHAHHDLQYKLMQCSIA